MISVQIHGLLFFFSELWGLHVISSKLHQFSILQGSLFYIINIPPCSWLIAFDNVIISTTDIKSAGIMSSAYLWVDPLYIVKRRFQSWKFSRYIFKIRASQSQVMIQDNLLEFSDRWQEFFLSFEFSCFHEKCLRSWL